MASRVGNESSVTRGFYGFKGADNLYLWLRGGEKVEGEKKVKTSGKERAQGGKITK